MNSPRVLHVIEGLSPYGAEHSMLNICVALRNRFAPTVIAFRGGILEERLVAAGVPTFVLQPDPCVSPSPRQRFAFCWTKISELRPDLVHTHYAYANTLGRIAAHLQGVPTVAHIRGYEGRWGTLAYKLLYRLAGLGRTRVIAISDGLGQQFRKATGISPQTIYNSIDETWFTPEAITPGDIRRELGLRPDAFLIGTVARLVEQKNHRAILRCAQRVCSATDDTHFVFAGDGELLSELAELRSALGLAGRVHFLGFREDVARVLNDIDVFLFMSHGEGFGRVLVEAMLMRRPIVATSVMGVNEIVRDGHEGFLVPPDDDAAAAERVLRLYRDTLLRERMGASGYQTATERFSLHVMSEKIAQVYEELLNA